MKIKDCFPEKPYRIIEGDPRTWALAPGQFLFFFEDGERFAVGNPEKSRVYYKQKSLPDYLKKLAEVEVKPAEDVVVYIPNVDKDKVIFYDSNEISAHIKGWGII